MPRVVVARPIRASSQSRQPGSVIRPSAQKRQAQYHLSAIDRTAHALRALFNVPVSTGTIQNFIHEAAGALTPTFDQISRAILAEPVYFGGLLWFWAPVGANEAPWCARGVVHRNSKRSLSRRRGHLTLALVKSNSTDYSVGTYRPFWASTLALRATTGYGTVIDAALCTASVAESPPVHFLGPIRAGLLSPSSRFAHPLLTESSAASLRTFPASLSPTVPLQFS